MTQQTQISKDYYTDYRRVVSGLCSGCVLQMTCISSCRRLKNLYRLVDEYELLKKAYSRACSELLNHDCFVGSTLEEVENLFKNDAEEKEPR